MLHRGWYQPAFQRDLVVGINEVAIADTPLMLVVSGGTTRAFDAVCPHRGANLCRGGQLSGDFVKCPFHGLPIALGEGALAVREWPCLVVGGLVFVRRPDGEDCGLAERLAELDADNFIIPGFELDISVPAELVIENAFDVLHFETVHGIGTSPAFTVEQRRTPTKALVAEGVFLLPPSRWQAAPPGEKRVRVPYRARCFSPTIVLSDVGGEQPYAMLTSTIPTGPRRCTVRLSLAVPIASNAAEPDVEACRYLLEGAKRGLSEDQTIWEAMSDTAPLHLQPADEGIVAFRAFCAELGG